MYKPDVLFKKMVDKIVELSEDDYELKDGIRWVDEQAQKKGTTFYDMFFEVIHKHDVNYKAKDWLNSRN